MTEKIDPKNNPVMLAGFIGVLAGVWGIVITILFMVSQIRMILPGTPLNVILGSDSGDFLFLGFHLAAFVLLLIIAISVIRSNSQSIFWAWLVIVLSIIIIGLSLIPGSTIGFPILPGGVGMLVSGFLLNRSSKRI